MQISKEPIYNTDELINILYNERARSTLQSSEKNINEEIATKSKVNKEIFIKDLDTNTYKRIVCIKIDEDGDLIIETQRQ